MSELEEFDETEENQDEYETPTRKYYDLCVKYSILPKLDVCATEENRKCKEHFSKEDNALYKNWNKDVWCNPPHSLTEEFVSKAHTMWVLNNINILMIVPANAIGAHYFDDIFDRYHAKYYRISGRIRFLQNGKPAPSSSRNGYFVVIWRKR